MLQRKELSCVLLAALGTASSLGQAQDIEQQTPPAALTVEAPQKPDDASSAELASVQVAPESAAEAGVEVSAAAPTPAAPPAAIPAPTTTVPPTTPVPESEPLAAPLAQTEEVQPVAEAPALAVAEGQAIPAGKAEPALASAAVVADEGAVAETPAVPVVASPPVPASAPITVVPAPVAAATTGEIPTTIGPLSAEDLDTLNRSPIQNVKTDLGFRYFSGQVGGDIGNFPTIYAQNYNNVSTVIVVGPNYYREFPLAELDQAYRAYKALLLIQGFDIPL